MYLQNHQTGLVWEWLLDCTYITSHLGNAAGNLPCLRCMAHISSQVYIVRDPQAWVWHCIRLLVLGAGCYGWWSLHVRKHHRMWMNPQIPLPNRHLMLGLLLPAQTLMKGYLCLNWIMTMFKFPMRSPSGYCLHLLQRSVSAQYIFKGGLCLTWSMTYETLL